MLKTTTIFLVFIASVHGGTYRLPIQRQTFGWDFRWFERGHHLEVAPAQLPLLASQTIKDRYKFEGQNTHNRQPAMFRTFPGFSEAFLSEDDIVWLSMYTTNISVGTPPVKFRAQVDTSWGPLFVPSRYCQDPPCWDHWPHIYDPLNSSTHHLNGTACRVSYPGQFGLWTWGGMEQDSLHVGGLEIENQTFESVSRWIPGELDPESLYDTALGLALRHIDMDETTLDSPSPFQSMAEQNLLDENVFTLRMSRRDDEIGELTLGGIPDSLDRSKLVEIPLTHEYEKNQSKGARFYSSNGWQIHLGGISFPSSEGETDLSLSTNHTAILSTSYPWIILPWKITKTIHEHLGFTENVACELRPKLPSVTFTFGPHGGNITLTPWDYVYEFYDSRRDSLKCVGVFGGYDEGESLFDGFALLGSPFLNGLYSVWNADRKTISFANRARDEK